MVNREYKVNQEISAKEWGRTATRWMTITDISRNTTMRLMKQKECFRIKLGNTHRIPKADFDKCLND